MKEKDNRDWPPHLQWPPLHEDLPMFEKIFLSIAFGAGILALILWAFFLFQMPLNPAG